MTDSDPIVGHVAIGSIPAVCAVAISNLAPEARALLQAALWLSPGEIGMARLEDAARAFAASVKGGAA